jgi:hypothetical protein
LSPRVPQKSQPRNARRENSVVACAEIPRALRLCRKLDSRARQEQAQNADKIDAPRRAKTATLSVAYMLAGVGGLELRNVASNYLFESSRGFPRSEPNSGHGDHSRLSRRRDTQLGAGFCRDLQQALCTDVHAMVGHSGLCRHRRHGVCAGDWLSTEHTEFCVGWVHQQNVLATPHA